MGRVVIRENIDSIGDDPLLSTLPIVVVIASVPCMTSSSSTALPAATVISQISTLDSSCFVLTMWKESSLFPLSHVEAIKLAI